MCGMYIQRTYQELLEKCRPGTESACCFPPGLAYSGGFHLGAEELQNLRPFRQGLLSTNGGLVVNAGGKLFEETLI